MHRRTTGIDKSIWLTGKMAKLLKPTDHLPGINIGIGYILISQSVGPDLVGRARSNDDLGQVVTVRIGEYVRHVACSLDDASLHCRRMDDLEERVHIVQEYLPQLKNLHLLRMQRGQAHTSLAETENERVTACGETIPRFLYHLFADLIL